MAYGKRGPSLDVAWFVESGLVSSKKGPIAYMARDNAETTPCERDSNAQLIAYVPEMIAFIRHIAATSKEAKNALMAYALLDKAIRPE